MDIHLLTVALSNDKYTCWTLDTEAMIKRRDCAFALFETTTGRLEHVGHIIPAVRLFLNHIGNPKNKAKTKYLRRPSFVAALVNNLGLHLNFLSYATTCR
jgi:hypothetical protein